MHHGLRGGWTPLRRGIISITAQQTPHHKRKRSLPQQPVDEEEEEQHDVDISFVRREKWRRRSGDIRWYGCDDL